MTDNSIKPGDEVEFELRRSTDGLGLEPFPRWDGERDRGGSSVWCRGIAERWTNVYSLEIVYENPHNGRLEQWVWPLDGFSKNRTGWVRAINQVWKRPKCECGSETVNLGSHSTWCPKVYIRTLEQVFRGDL